VQSPCETNAFIQSSLFNDIHLSNQQSSYVKLQQVKTEWRASREGGREKEIERQINRMRWNIGQRCNWRRLKMAIGEKGHLSAFSKVNQQNK